MVSEAWGNQEEFLARLQALRRDIAAELGPQDLAHLRKLERWGRACTAFGYATAWLLPNPLSILALSLGRFWRWKLAHHVLHGGYDKIPNVPLRYTSQGFARGVRRYIDWFDWLRPESWVKEHNHLHHSHLGDPEDPDQVELVACINRFHDTRLPMWFRYVFIAWGSMNWKWLYYAPSTLKQWQGYRTRPTAGAMGSMQFSVLRDQAIFSPFSPQGRELWLGSYLPYATVTFGVIPLIALGLAGVFAGVSVLVNSLLAEALTNLHSFVVIVTNHAGDDLPRFKSRPKTRAEFFVRQVVGSTNFTTGGDLNDFLHGWLNYQIEHHVWPNLSMRQYQSVQPRLKALCLAQGVPYVQESVFTRLGKTVDVLVGKTRMRQI